MDVIIFGDLLELVELFVAYLLTNVFIALLSIHYAKDIDSDIARVVNLCIIGLFTVVNIWIFTAIF